MTEKVQPPVWLEEPKGMRDMRRLAKRVVDGVPKVQAAVLFGSRARMTARRDSDWDVALLVPQRYMKEVLLTAPRISNVNYVPLSPQRLRKRYNHLGSLERSVFMDGVVLAGQWDIPRPLRKTRVSYTALYHRLSTALGHAQSAYHRLTEERAYRSDDVDNFLSAQTKDAAKFISKAALLHMGVDTAEVHNVEKMVESLSSKSPNHAWVSTIRSFSEILQSRHFAENDFEDEVTYAVAESERRLCRVLKFYGEVLEDVAKKRPGFRREAIKLCNGILFFVSGIMGERKWKWCPEEVRESLLLWEETAQRVLKRIGDDKSG